MKFNLLSRIVCMAIALTGTAATNAAESDTLTSAQKEQIENVVHDYLVQHPQVIMEAVQSLQQQQQKQAANEAKSTIEQESQTIFASPTSPVLGNPKGTVTLVEFMDYQCPYCKRMTSAILQAMKDNTNLRIVVKELPIFGDSSNFAAQAALASVKQGKYSVFHNALMEAHAPFTKQQILDIAKANGLDIQKLQADMNDKQILAELKTNTALANQLQLAGTPAFIISKITIDDNKANKPTNTVFVPGALSREQLMKIIQEI